MVNLMLKYFSHSKVKIGVGLLVFLFSTIQLYSQTKKPQIALVLSGGGARGVAHVPVLQALDSLNIVPDLIVGNSMGSIVGGLYAMGYSGNEIAALVNSTKWSDVLSSKTALNNVSVEEKSEYDKYAIQLDIIKGIPKPTAYLLNDQNLRDKLSELTFPVYHITDFDSLQIPFRAVATDIVNSEQKILNKGSLSLAMRASMSLPGVFEPVELDGTLLVDGGILNNFPTDIAKDWGADIIIGSDVAGPGKAKEKLDNISAIVTQTMMLNNYKRHTESQQLCNIFIDHNPNLTYSTADFSHSSALYEEGKTATVKNIKPLVELSEQLKTFNQKKPKLPEIENKIVFDTIIYKDISPANHSLLRKRMNLNPYETYSKEYLNEAVKRAIGTNIFRKIEYESTISNTKKVLEITGYEKSRHQLNGALHYDLYRGVGVTGNYTGRNILGSASRLLVSLDIAEQPKFLVQVQKNFGNDRQWWWKSQVLGRQLRQKIYIDGDAADDLKAKSLEYTNQINRNINSLSDYIGLGFTYRYTDLKPKVSPELNTNVIDLSKYRSNYLGVDIHYDKNTLNDVFYPTNGSSFRVVINRSIIQDVSVDFINNESANADGRTNGFTKLHLNYKKIIPMKTETIGFVEASAGFMMKDALKSNQVSIFDFGFPEFHSLGGNVPIQQSNTFSFHGLQEEELPVSQFMMLKFGLQFNPVNKIYITPHLNFASVGFDDFNDYTKNIFKLDGSWQNLANTSYLFSVGTTLSYDSILGPVEFNASWINDVNQIRLFLSVGIPFNR